MDDLTGKRKCGGDFNLEESSTATASCKKALGSEEEDEINSMLSMILPSLAVPCTYLVAREKKVTVSALLPSVEKDAKNNVSTSESSTGMLTAHHAFPASLTDPEKLVSHNFSDVPLMHRMV